MENSDSRPAPAPTPAPLEDESGAQTDTLQRAVSGDYQLLIGDVLKEAWARVSGNKVTVWTAVLMYAGVLFGLSLVFAMLFGPAPADGVPPSFSPVELLQQLISGLLLTPLWVGLIFVGVAIASDQPAKPASIFSWYGLALKLLFTYLLMGLMITLGTLLLVLPGIYLAVSYQLALPLVADKNLGPWEALETSRKAVTRKWFTFFGLWLLALLAILGSMILLGIPLIWVIPTVLIGLGILYRNVFGAEPATLLIVAGQSTAPKNS